MTTIDSIPFQLAPSSRPSSPSNSINSNDPLLHRFALADLPRRNTGVFSSCTAKVLPPLLSITVKGSWEVSPWGINWNKEIQVDDIEIEGPWNDDLPIDLIQWKQWEDDKMKLKEETILRQEKGKGRAEFEGSTFITLDEVGLRAKDYPTPRAIETEESLNSNPSREVNTRRTQSVIVDQSSRLSAASRDELVTHQSLPSILPSLAQYVPSTSYLSTIPLLQPVLQPVLQPQQKTLTSILPTLKPFATSSAQRLSSSKVHPASLPRIHSRNININSLSHTSPPKKSPPKKSKKPSTSNSLPKVYQDVSSSLPEPEVVNSLIHSHHSSKNAHSHSLPNLSSQKLVLRDPLVGGSPIKSNSNSMESVNDWGATKSKDSLGFMMNKGGIEAELLDEGGDSEFMLTDSPKKPLPNYPLSYSSSSLPFPSTFPLDLLSLPLNPLLDPNHSATLLLPLETSTPAVLLRIDGSGEDSLGLIGSGEEGIQLTVAGTSRHESQSGLELEDDITSFLNREVEMI